MSGLNPKEHAICSIGAVDFKNPKRTFYLECCIPKDAKAHPQALEVNGFTEEQIRDESKPSEVEAVKKFIEWCKESDEITIAGQNVFFDRSFLLDVCEKNNIYWPFKHRIVDSHSATYAHMRANSFEVPISDRISSINLDKCAKYVGLTEEPRPHNALTGAKFEAEVFSRLFYGKNLLEEFKDFPVPQFLLKQE